MKFVWQKGKTEEKNRTLAFFYPFVQKDDELRLSAGDAYRVFLNGKFLSYGPSRTAAGYSRVRSICLQENGFLCIEVAGYHTACYANDRFPPFFGAELWRDGRLVLDTDGFSCAYLNDRLQRVERYSYQRNYVEIYAKEGGRYAFNRGNVGIYPAVETEEVPYRVTLLDGGEDNASYEKISFSFVEERVSDMRELKREKLWWTDYVEKGLAEGFLPKEYEFDFDAFIKDKETQRTTYALSKAHTGLLKAEISSENDGFALFVFDEYSFDEVGLDIRFRRTSCNDYVLVHISKGQREFLSFEPYELKYLRVYTSRGVTISEPCVVALENKDVKAKLLCEDAELTAIYEAAVNSFCQNALDIFMDCPGRERAGWLCDSYFTAQAEALLCGNSRIEERFLENFLLGDWEEIPSKMLPMCYPAQLYEKIFIPNWAMWFLLELEDFYRRAPHSDLVDRFREKVYGVLEYFKGFENEYELLEDLESWVFIEWSVANDPSHISGVNIPSNMTYAKALSSVARLYGDEALAEKSERIKKAIVRLGFDGKVFKDNLIRKEGVLVLTENYSETCQYYALFCGISQRESFERFLLGKYGDEKAAKLPEASNMLTGHCLRLWWLIEKGYRKQAIIESKQMLLAMANKTGTLWENDKPSASCNHGFTSVLTVFLIRILTGYRGCDVKTHTLFFDEEYEREMDCEVVLPVGDKECKVCVRKGEREIFRAGFTLHIGD